MFCLRMQFKGIYFTTVLESIRKPSCKLGKDPTLTRNRTTAAMLCMDLKKTF